MNMPDLENNTLALLKILQKEKSGKDAARAIKSPSVINVYSGDMTFSTATLMRRLGVGFTELKNSLENLQAQDIVRQFNFTHSIPEEMGCSISLQRDFNRKYEMFLERAKALPQATLKSLHLISRSLKLTDVIFLVLDRQYEYPIRFPVKNKQGGPAYIKSLHDVAYIVNAPGKRTPYDRKLADNINNGLFKTARIKEYLKMHGFRKPTLVKKEPNEKILVLTGEVEVKTELVKDVPLGHQSLYTDKTN
jgi:hypothetical protein